jgi:hypothetical protein
MRPSHLAILASALGLGVTAVASAAERVPLTLEQLDQVTAAGYGYVLLMQPVGESGWRVAETTPANAFPEPTDPAGRAELRGQLLVEAGIATAYKVVKIRW